MNDTQTSNDIFDNWIFEDISDGEKTKGNYLNNRYQLLDYKQYKKEREENAITKAEKRRG